MWPFYNMFHSSWGKNPEDSPDVFGDQSIFQVICRSIASKQKDLATRLVCCFGCGNKLWESAENRTYFWIRRWHVQNFEQMAWNLKVGIKTFGIWTIWWLKGKKCHVWQIPHFIVSHIWGTALERNHVSVCHLGLSRGCWQWNPQGIRAVGMDVI